MSNKIMIMITLQLVRVRSNETKSTTSAEYLTNLLEGLKLALQMWGLVRTIMPIF